MNKPQNTLDEYLLKIGILNSFMPNEYLENNIFHYTSAEGLRSILFADSKKITLWASRYDCMNDMSEGKIALSVYLEVCDELLENGEISLELYNLFTKIRPARTQLLVYGDGTSIQATRKETDRFVCSFSKNKDSLTMWNYYSKGSKYEGYNISLFSRSVTDSFRSFFGKGVSIHVYPIIYAKTAQKKLIIELLKKLQEYYEKKYEPQIRYIISNQLTEWGLIFKSDFFQHEEEVRIIIDIPKKSIDNPPFVVNYKMNCGYIVPYIELKIDKDSLMGVSIGPLQCTDEQKELQKEILHEMLISNGYNALETYSKIPVRY